MVATSHSDSCDPCYVKHRLNIGYVIDSKSCAQICCRFFVGAPVLDLPPLVILAELSHSLKVSDRHRSNLGSKHVGGESLRVAEAALAVGRGAMLLCDVLRDVDVVVAVSPPCLAHSSVLVCLEELMASVAESCGQASAWSV